MQEFRLDKNHTTLMRFCLVASIAFTAFGISLPFLPDDEGSSLQGTVAIASICTLIFGSLSICIWRLLKKLPFVDVAADEDGVWYLHLGKSKGLVAWGNISEIRQKQLSQCLELLGVENKLLLRIEYQLNEFELLRHWLMENTVNLSSDVHQSEFSKGRYYKYLNLGVIAVFSLVGIYIGCNGHPFLGFGGVGFVVAMITYEYLMTATSLRITCDGLRIIYPYSKRYISFSDVEEILIADEYQKGNRIPEVWVISRKAKKPFKFKQLSVDAHILFNVLRKALDSK